MKHYNSTTPPLYRPQDMTSPPTALFTGGHDILADPTDVAYLKEVLKPIGQPSAGSNFQEAYEHLDFVWAINAHTKIYPDVVKLANQYSAAKTA